jgi:hypothetical protein
MKHIKNNIFSNYVLFIFYFFFIGIIPSSFRQIFDYIALNGNDKKFMVQASYLEIYNGNY